MTRSLDDIVYHMYESSGNSKYVLAGRKPLHPDEAKAQIKALFLDIVSGYELAGPYTHRGMMDLTETSLAEATNNVKVSARNELRAELRKEIEKL